MTLTASVRKQSERMKQTQAHFAGHPASLTTPPNAAPRLAFHFLTEAYPALAK
jgi:hypothetical protein